MPEKTLGEFIRDRRIERKTGLRNLAKVVEITPSWQSDIEYDRRVPSEDVLRRIAVQLTLEFDELMARRWSLSVKEAKTAPQTEPRTGN